MQPFDTSELEARATALIDAARKAGADAADAVAVRGISLGVSVREGNVEESERSEGDDYGLRVFVGKRQAIVSTNDAGQATIRDLAERAVAMARLAPEDPYAGLLEDASTPPDLALDLLDPAVPGVEALRDLAIRAEHAALSVDGVAKSGGASAGWGLGGFALATSGGFLGASLRSRTSLSATAIAGQGTGMERDYAWHSVVHGGDLESPEEIGRRAGGRAAARLNPRKVASARVPVIFEHRVASSMLGHLAGAINGAAIARGSSFLRDKRGERIFAPGIRVTDDPTRPRGLASRTFDAEGVPAQVLDLVSDGVLQDWILDASSARKLGLKTNGRAARGASSPPSPSTTNLTLEPGRQSLNSLMIKAGRGFLVTDLIGSGANLVTGDYSRGAAGFWFEDGAIAYPVSEVTIAGHLAEMFAALVPADDLEIRGAVNAPSMLVGELTLAGR
jgi:PmbA protein